MSLLSVLDGYRDINILCTYLLFSLPSTDAILNLFLL